MKRWQKAGLLCGSVGALVAGLVLLRPPDKPWVPLEANPVAAELCPNWETALVTARVDGRSCPLVLDTGTEDCSLVMAGAPPVPPGVSRTSGRTPRTMHVALGPLRRRVPVYPVRYSAVRRRKDVGMLGNRFFMGKSPAEAVRLTIDGPGRRVWIDARPDRRRHVPSPGSIAVPFRVRGGPILVRAALNGGPVRDVAIDYGCQYDLFISGALPSELHWPTNVPWLSLPPRPTRLSLGGDTLSVPTYVLRRGPRIPPLIGAPFLFKYHVVIDYRDRMLYLEPPGPRVAATHPGDRADGDRAHSPAAPSDRQSPAAATPPARTGVPGIAAAGPTALPDWCTCEEDATAHR